MPQDRKRPPVSPARKENAVRSKAPQPEGQRRAISEDAVDESSILSFPASDPPSWTPLHAGSPRKRRRP